MPRPWPNSARQAYLDGELCGVGPDGVTSFNIVQLASDCGNAAAPVFFLFDLLHLDGEDLRPRPLIERKERLRTLLANAPPCLHYSDHVIGQSPAFYEKAGAIVSKRTDAPYTPGNRGLWRKVKCLNRAEFVVVGWTKPEGRRPYLGALLLAYYDPAGRLIYVGRVGLQPLATDRMPLDVAPPRGSRFGSPLVLSCVHWVRPELACRGKQKPPLAGECQARRLKGYSAPGPKTICCGRSSMKGCGKTSRQAMCAGKQHQATGRAIAR